MKVICDVSESEWWTWIEKAGDATFFQTPLWAKLLLEGFRDFRVDTRLIELADGGRVLIPLMRRHRLRGTLATLESMPFGTYGGFIGERALSRTEALGILAELRHSRPPVARLMITPQPLGRFPIPEDAFHCQNFVHFIRLDEGYDRIWKTRFSRGLRYSVRKSLRRGVRVGLEHGEQTYLDFCRLYHSTAQRWERKPPFGEPFFAALSRLGERHTQLWVARLEERLIAGCVIFTYGEHQTPYVGGFDREFRGYDPNNLMYAEAMKWGARQGYRYFNFLSSAGIKGVEHFKSSFGTQRLFFNYYLYENPLLRLLKSHPLGALRAHRDG